MLSFEYRDEDEPLEGQIELPLKTDEFYEQVEIPLAACGCGCGEVEDPRDMFLDPISNKLFISIAHKVEWERNHG